MCLGSDGHKRRDRDEESPLSHKEVDELPPSSGDFSSSFWKSYGVVIYEEKIILVWATWICSVVNGTS
jgi:hypothetical protein